MVLRGIGAILVVAGLVLACAPTLVHDPGPAADTFAAVERRIPWGGVLGAGALMVAWPGWKPVLVFLGAFVSWVTAGLLVARLIGLALDGSDPKQWLWVGVEAAVVVAAAAFVRWRRRVAAPG